MATKRTTKKTHNAPIGCLIGLFLIILLSGLILFNKEKIEKTLKNTRVIDLFSQKPLVQDKKNEPVQLPSQTKDSAPEIKPDTQKKQPVTSSQENQKPQSEPGKNTTTTKTPQDERNPQDTQPPQKPSTFSPSQPQTTAKNAPKTASPTASQPEKVTQTVERSLYFMQLAEDGSLVRTKVTRAIKTSDSPLIDVIQNLLNGPTESEKKRGLISVIPPGSKIISATVKDGVAYLNFNDAFQFNSYGVEGYTAQLKQLVWTATEFTTVRAVQILIENKNLIYLGGEGIRIDRPLSRESFQ